MDSAVAASVEARCGPGRDIPEYPDDVAKFFTRSRSTCLCANSLLVVSDKCPVLPYLTPVCRYQPSPCAALPPGSNSVLFGKESNLRPSIPPAACFIEMRTND
jgi:hypothetical protein